MSDRARFAIVVARFYEELRDLLRRAGITVRIWPVPVEVVDAIPFTRDIEPGGYDRDHAHALHAALTNAHRVLTQFRGGFLGKARPVHFFWGGFDLAATRFSGRPAPRHPGGAPNCPAWVMEEAYSHEVSSCGYWPGGGAEGVFYSYAYPTPPGYTDRPVQPSEAAWSDELGEFVLPYEVVRTARNPDETLTAFLSSTYEAAVTTANWDRKHLERLTAKDDHD